MIRGLSTFSVLAVAMVGTASASTNAAVPLAFHLITQGPPAIAAREHLLQFEISSLTPESLIENSSGNFATVGVSYVLILPRQPSVQLVGGVSYSGVAQNRVLSAGGVNERIQKNTHFFGLKLGTEKSFFEKDALRPFVGVYLRPQYAWNNLDSDQNFYLPLEGAVGVEQRFRSFSMILGGQALSAFSRTPDIGVFFASRVAI